MGKLNLALVILLVFSSCKQNLANSLEFKIEEPKIGNGTQESLDFKKFVLKSFEETRTIFSEKLKESGFFHLAYQLSKLSVDYHEYSLENKNGLEFRSYVGISNTIHFTLYNSRRSKGFSDADLLLNLRLSLYENILSIVVESLGKVNEPKEEVFKNVSNPELLIYLKESILKKYYLVGYFFSSFDLGLDLNSYVSECILNSNDLISKEMSYLRIDKQVIIETIDLGNSSISKNENLKKALNYLKEVLSTDLISLGLGIHEYKETIKISQKYFSKNNLKLERDLESVYDAYLNNFMKIMAFSTSAKKGKVYLNNLKLRIENSRNLEYIANIDSKKNKELELYEKNYTTRIGFIEDKKITFSSTNESGTCVNSWLSDEDAFKCDWNYPGGKNSLNFSSILWFQYQYLKNSKDIDFRHEPVLKQIKRVDISNLDTRSTILAILNSQNLEEKTVKANSLEGMALLGTPNGKSAVWLAHDYWENLQKKPTEIQINRYNMTIKMQ